jgi:signal transduction histidine kinase
MACWLLHGSNRQNEKIRSDVILTQVSDTMHGFLEERQATLHLELNPGPLEVRASPLQLELALVNLVRNAIESRPQGAEVSVRATCHDTWAVVQIEDNGPGLTPEQREHLFDPFYTTRIREGGTGLGATVAYAIVQQHGGRIEVHTRLGVGTRMEVWLPLTMAKEDQKESPTDACSVS